jgi:hypothetical protein
MIDSQMIAPVGQFLSEEQIIETLHKGLEGKFTNQRGDGSQ